jgi:phosphoenolpyruvate-protein kinase (PTS system EI component)
MKTGQTENNAAGKKVPQELRGESVVLGWGVGKAYLVGRAVKQQGSAPVASIAREEVGAEIVRFNDIRDKAHRDYQKLRQDLDSDSAVDSSILNTYEYILDDPAFVSQVVETMSVKLFDLETSIRLVSNEFIKGFEAADTAYFKERAGDVVEVCEKLVSYLNNEGGRFGLRPLENQRRHNDERR